MIKQQKGTVIIFVVCIIGIVSLLYASIYAFISTERRIQQSLVDRTKAYYVAESGLDRELAMLKQGTQTDFSLSNPFSPAYKDAHQATVIIVEAPAGTFTITSTGVYRNTKRIIEAIVSDPTGTFTIQSQKEIN